MVGETGRASQDPFFWVSSILCWFLSGLVLAGVPVCVVLGGAREASSFWPKVTLLRSHHSCCCWGGGWAAVLRGGRRAQDSSGQEIRPSAHSLPFRIWLLMGDLFPIQIHSEPLFRLGPEWRGGKGGQGTPMSSDHVLVSIKGWELDEQSHIQT